MSANVHVIEERRFSTQERLNRQLEASRTERGAFPNVVFTVNEHWSMDRICRRVLLRSGGQVGVLRLICHGNASYMELGTCLRSPADVTSFRLLRGCWIGRYPRIEIDACGVVSSTLVSCSLPELTIEQWATVCTPGTVSSSAPGHQLMQALADAAGVLVIASYDVQLGPNPRGFEGRIRHYRPTQYFRTDGANPRAA
jgi:hypothetical protein